MHIRGNISIRNNHPSDAQWDMKPAPTVKKQHTTYKSPFSTVAHKSECQVNFFHRLSFNKAKSINFRLSSIGDKCFYPLCDLCLYNYYCPSLLLLLNEIFIYYSNILNVLHLFSENTRVTSVVHKFS